ncbi:MAG TPA: DUF2851 domain-containing protein [Chitinophagaceae bacterium]|nr:DUF2851 domain-containing protein [Chitinophagaceae bacterium]
MSSAPMNERLLQFIWQHRFANLQDLFSTDGMPLRIIHPGKYNSNQGPDFLEARVQVGQETWIGHVELHIRSSDWLLHGHNEAGHYRNLILHVVWEHDCSLRLSCPTLELRSRIPGIMLQRFEHLMKTKEALPCSSLSAGLDPIRQQKWIEHLLWERLEQKSNEIRVDLEAGQFHWEQTAWKWMARYAGLPVNQEAFEAMAASIPFSVLIRHRSQQIQLEALLMGQAGLLDTVFTDHYPVLLQKEYRFLQKKYQLTGSGCRVNFLRMRPASFPTIRISQLAALIHQQGQVFSRLRDMEDVGDAMRLLQVSANDYWNDHYLPDKPAPFSQKHTGGHMVRGWLVNAFIPLIYCYGQVNRMQALQEKAIDWLHQLPAENHQLIRRMSATGLPNQSAADSQALIRLQKNYCDDRRCLQCAIGHAILSK